MTPINTTPGPYALVGARLVERGYSAIAVIPGEKRPGYLRGGRPFGIPDWNETYSKRLPGRIEIQVWTNSGAGVCVVCGPGSQHTVAVDIDTDQPDIKAAIEAAIPGTTVRKRASKGETLFYRGPEIITSPSWNVNGARVCDLIGPGRQTVLPPSRHPSGVLYRWTGPDALEDVDPSELPLLTPAHIEAIGEALRPFGYQDAERPPRQCERSDGGGTGGFLQHHRDRLSAMALDNLDKWVPHLNLYRCRRTQNGYQAVATWRPSNTGKPPEKRKLNLSISGRGISDWGDGPRGYSPFDLVMSARACGYDEAYDWLEAMVDPSDVVIDLKAICENLRKKKLTDNPTRFRA